MFLETTLDTLVQIIRHRTRDPEGDIVRPRVMGNHRGCGQGENLVSRNIPLHTGAAAVRYRTGDEVLYNPESWATTEDKLDEKIFLETSLYAGVTFIRYRTGRGRYCMILPSQGQQQEMKARGRCF